MKLRETVGTMSIGDRQPIQFTTESQHEPIAIEGVLLRGRQSSPLVGIIAGVHGDEYDGICACVKLIQNLQVEQLTTSVLIVPIANRYAFQAQQRRTSADDVDLNRVFPGNSDGAFSERLAKLLFDSIVCNVDAVLSLHGWLQTGDVVDYVEIPDPSSKLYRRCASIAIEAGFPLIRNSGWLEGRLGAAAVEQGVPILEAEVGGCGIADIGKTDRYVEYIRRAISAIAANNDEQQEIQLKSGQSFFGKQTVVTSETPGIWIRHVDNGQTIKAGSVIGEIVEISGLSSLPVRASTTTLVGAVRKRGQVVKGDDLVWLFSEMNEG